MGYSGRQQHSPVQKFVQRRVVGIEIDFSQGGQIGPVAIRGGLAAVANVPRDDQLGVGINRSPRPNVASGVRSGLGELDVLRLRVAEQPDFIALDGLCFADTLRTVTSWKAAQALPASIRSLVTVLMLTLVTREMDRIDDPSQSV